MIDARDWRETLEDSTVQRLVRPLSIVTGEGSGGRGAAREGSQMINLPGWQQLALKYILL